MGDEYDSSVDVSDVDTSSDSSADYSVDTPSDDYSDSIDDFSEDTSSDDYGEIADDIPDEITEDTYDDSTTDLAEDTLDVPEDIEENISSENFEETTEDIPEDILEDTEEEIVEDNQENTNGNFDDIPEDVESDETEVEASSDIPEEIEEDVEPEVPDELAKEEAEVVDETAEAEPTDDLTEQETEAVDETAEIEPAEEVAEEEAEVIDETAEAETTDELAEEDTEVVDETADAETTDEPAEEEAEVVDETAEAETTDELAVEEGEVVDEIIEAETTEEFVEEEVEVIDETAEVKPIDEVAEAETEGVDENIDNTTEVSNDKKLIQDDAANIDVSTQEEAERAISEYYGKHDYSPGDYDIYSQDPEWRNLMRKAYPEAELPELAISQEEAANKIAEYYGKHDYSPNDYDIYSQDPEWRELTQLAYPGTELPPLITSSIESGLDKSSEMLHVNIEDQNTYITQEFPPLTKSNSAEYRSIVKSLEYANVDYRPIRIAEQGRTTQEIVEQLGGGDLTKGSCSSLAFAYAGNKAGYNVLDFRDGESRSYFSQNDSIESIANLPGVKSKTIYGRDDIHCANKLMKKMEGGKEYYLATGLHASIVRKADNGYEFLELQSAKNNGWQNLDSSVLKNRFGCVTDNDCKYPNFLIDVTSLGNSEEFRNVLGFINTAEENQMKGASGYVK